MKRNRAPSQDTRNDHSELPVRLFRAISDVMRQLDDERSRTEEVADLFTPQVETQRMKLRDYCEKLMFTAPDTHGKKAEDILWRKVFYEVVSTVKRLNKSMKLSIKDSSMIEAHLQCGIGFYHHLIMKLQSQFRLDLRGVVDFPIATTDRGLKKDKVIWTNYAIESGALEWAQNAIHRSLIFLGDISRYLTDLDPSKGLSSAERYYTQALNWKPECGTPHNQLGNLSTNRNFSLNAAYHFMRCLTCVDKFDGAEGNLLHLFENNARILDEQTRLQNQSIPVPNLKKMITSFLHISYAFFFDKDDPQITRFCSDVFIAFEACMEETFAQTIHIANSMSEPSTLTDDILFKMIVISILCITQLKAKNSQQLMGGVALFLALLSQVLHFAVKRLEMTLPLPSGPLPLKNILFERRRRKRRVTVSSDVSEEENDKEEDAESDLSAEENLIFDECVDSDGDSGVVKEKTVPVIANGYHSLSPDNHSSKPWELPVIEKNKTFQHIHKLNKESYILQTIKVGFDWIESNQSIFKSCGTATSQLISRLVAFLNYLCTVPGHDHIIQFYDDDIPSQELLCSIPLPEDARVRGLTDLQLAQSKLNWDYLRARSLKSTEETYCRILTLIRFGQHLAASDICSLHFDKSKLWFSAESSINGIGSLNVETKERNPTPVAGDKLENLKTRNVVRTGRVPIDPTLSMKLCPKETDGYKLANVKRLFKDGDMSKAGFENDLKKLNFQKINGLLMVNLAKASLTCKNAVNENKGTKDNTIHKNESDREKLMHQLGKLWLKSEVSNLEDKTRKVVKDSLSPYLVPDCEAFLNHPSLIKQLMCSKKFIVLIPTIVLSALDECKQGSSKVRDTLRWLEWQLRNGKRNVRLQRSNEHLQVPYIKPPKKKDKEAWMFMHVVECCNYLCNQSTGEKNPELVTLLTGSKSLAPNGSNSSPNGFSLTGLAKSAGINVEHIEAFFTKWKSSSKSHG